MDKRIKLAAAVGVLGITPFLFGFTDLPETHWAYTAVEQLSVDGTVSGFEDGTFRPNDPVTRAQLVKMVGVQGEVRTDYVSDLKHRHWAYDVLIHSKLRTIDNKILPDEAATREQVAVYMYDCYGGNEESYAPSVVVGNLTSNRKEVGWVYEHGIMVGDDGINLRLDDNLTRAEAAVLISNSRNKIQTVGNFADNVPESTLEKVFNNSGLFDAEYKPDAVLTNGEAARAAYKFQKGIVSSLYYENEADFEHEYARDLKAMEPVLGEGRISSEFADEQAMPEDVLGMFAFAAASKIQTPVGYGAIDTYYSDAQLKSGSLNAPLTFSYEIGIRPYGGGVLKSGTPVTHKVMAAVLLQYDMLWGIQSSVTVNHETAAYNDEPMRFDDLPENEEQFKGILKNVPNDVYLMPFIMNGGETTEGMPVNIYGFCSDLKNAFAARLAAFSSSIYEQYGVKADLTFYPQLVYDSGNGFTMRVKAEIKDAGANPPSLGELFPGTDTEKTAANGAVEWMEIELDYMFFNEG